MNEALTQLGIGGLVAVLVIREVLTFLRERRNNKGNGVDLSLLAKQIDEMHQWHAVTDGNGVKVWYVRRSLEEAIRQLATNIATQTDILKELMRETQGTRKDLEWLKDASRSD
jgi:hypothetical protein